MPAVSLAGSEVGDRRMEIKIIRKKIKDNKYVYSLHAEIKDNLNSEQFKFLAELTPYCIEARYGDYKTLVSNLE